MSSFFFFLGFLLGSWILRMWKLILNWKSVYIATIFDLFRVLLLNQNRKAACGRHKEEIFIQLRELTKSEPLDPEPQQYLPSGNLSTGFERDMKDDIVPSHEVKLLFHWPSTCVITYQCWFLNLIMDFLFLDHFQPCNVYSCALLTVYFSGLEKAVSLCIKLFLLIHHSELILKKFWLNILHLLLRRLIIPMATMEGHLQNLLNLKPYRLLLMLCLLHMRYRVKKGILHYYGTSRRRKQEGTSTRFKYVLLYSLCLTHS